jgi:uncharacterized protein (DUF2267 family)
MELDELSNQLAQRVGITPEQANTAITLVSKTLLQKAEPDKASSILSKLPESITNFFSDNEKDQFKTTKQDVSKEEVIRKLDEAGIKDPKKAQQTTEEAVRLLKSETGEQDLLDDVMGKFKSLNPFD